MPRRSKLYRLSSFQSSSISALVSFLPSFSETGLWRGDNVFRLFSGYTVSRSFVRISHPCFKSLKDSKAAFVSNPSLLVAQCSERHRVQQAVGTNLAEPPDIDFGLLCLPLFRLDRVCV
ncbi:hypothetical protein F2Q69_00037216 [Brassica cretica]|uniref:Uncharacterized protein n=1 Tax=Brassica cretica TaxID=69181 RepID=A0A8S9STI8_BRACR|nr:hypothetical protein F2Q69_00037216 [Brassica cretica]